MAHFLRGRNFEAVEGVSPNSLHKKPEIVSYRRGKIKLAERWLKTIESDGLYLEQELNSFHARNEPWIETDANLKVQVQGCMLRVVAV